MASESEINEIQMQSLLERLITSRNRDLSLFIPFLLGLTSTDPDQNLANPDHNPENHPSPDDQHQRERLILINPLTQGMVVIEGTGLDTLFQALPRKDGQPPASKSAIEAMPNVKICEGEEGVCVICLDEWETGAILKEMPCKHKFHGGCIQKWLMMHGSCPVCRFKMPEEGNDEGKKREEEEGDERRRARRGIWVSFSFGSNSRRRTEDEVDGDLNGLNWSDLVDNQRQQSESETGN